jgi:hypothetical protein
MGSPSGDHTIVVEIGLMRTTILASSVRSILWAATWNSADIRGIKRIGRNRAVARRIALVIAFICAPFVVMSGQDPAGDQTTPQAPYISISTHRASPKSDRVPDSLSGLNPHEIVVMVGPTEKEQALLTRYIVVPGEPAEWQKTSWQDYEFKILVNLDEHMRFAHVIASRNGKRVLACTIHLNLHKPGPSPTNPEEAGARLEYLETQNEGLRERNRKLSDFMWRTIQAQFQPVPGHWLDANCTLVENRWGLTNEWVARELDPDLIRAQYPTGLSDDDDRRAAEFLDHWRNGDRLFAYATPAHLHAHPEYGYIIVRECKVVAKLLVMIS